MKSQSTDATAGNTGRALPMQGDVVEQSTLERGTYAPRPIPREDRRNKPAQNDNLPRRDQPEPPLMRAPRMEMQMPRSEDALERPTPQPQEQRVMRERAMPPERQVPRAEARVIEPQSTRIGAIAPRTQAAQERPMQRPIPRERPVMAPKPEAQMQPQAAEQPTPTPRPNRKAKTKEELQQEEDTLDQQQH